MTQVVKTKVVVTTIFVSLPYLLERAGGAGCERGGARFVGGRYWAGGLEFRDVLELFAPLEAGARGDKAAKDDVLFQPAEAVDAAAQRGVDENLRRLLK